MFDARCEAMAAAAPLAEPDRYLVWARYCQIHQDPARRELATRLAAALGLEGLGAGLAPVAAPA
jgi:hypothetical protein